MQLANEARIGRPPEEVFAALLDMAWVAECLPGTRLTGRSGDAYTGEWTVRAGPLRAAYTGTVRYLETDRARRRVVVRARGTERDGQGDADAHVVLTVGPDGDGAVVSFDTNLMVRGRVAQYGRADLAERAGELTARFAANLAARLARPAPARTEPAEPAGHAGPPGPDERRPFTAVAFRRAAAPAAAVLAGVTLAVLLARRAHRARHKRR